RSVLPVPGGPISNMLWTISNAQKRSGTPSSSLGPQRSWSNRFAQQLPRSVVTPVQKRLPERRSPSGARGQESSTVDQRSAGLGSVDDRRPLRHSRSIPASQFGVVSRLMGKLGTLFRRPWMRFPSLDHFVRHGADGRRDRQPDLARSTKIERE